MLDLWIQRLLISRNKKSSYVKRLCYHCPTRSKKDAYRLWNVDWLNSDARKIVEKTPIVNVEVVSSLKRVIDPEELSLFDEYDGY